MRTLLLNLYDYFLIYFASPEWEKTLLILKSLSVTICFLLLVVLVYLIFQLRANIRNSVETATKSIGTPSLPKKRMTKKWNAILKKLETGDESNLKLAVIEADKILDDLLKKIGYQGENMGERLKQLTPAQIANLEALWQAHKLRNSIVHDPDFRLTRSQAENAIKIYQRTLEDLQAL
jgi:hypothetical protein